MTDIKILRTGGTSITMQLEYLKKMPWLSSKYIFILSHVYARLLDVGKSGSPQYWLWYNLVNKESLLGILYYKKENARGSAAHKSCTWCNIEVGGHYTWNLNGHRHIHFYLRTHSQTILWSSNMNWPVAVMEWAPMRQCWSTKYLKNWKSPSGIQY